MPSITASPDVLGQPSRHQSCRLVHDDQGRMRLIKPSRPQPPNRQLEDTHTTATLYARELLSINRFPTAPNSSTETLDNWSVYDYKLALGMEGVWRDSRYSPYLPDGVPTKSRMKIDDAVEFVRVRVFKKQPVTLETKRNEALLNETLNRRYGKGPGLASSLRLKLKRWRLGKDEKHDIIHRLLQKVR
ncbi:hypothetical protein K440DRAFT_638991 [Wilcoxina mikolae CBS 423.85]|nr:hypothetical protein K440DRAFT_638991 [Wilcoxina mikolae CBS 423.85]